MFFAYISVVTDLCVGNGVGAGVRRRGTGTGARRLGGGEPGLRISKIVFAGLGRIAKIKAWGVFKILNFNRWGVSKIEPGPCRKSKLCPTRASFDFEYAPGVTLNANHKTLNPERRKP